MMRARLCRVCAAVVVVGALVGACTSASGARVMSSPDLTPGGTAYPLASSSVSATSSRSPTAATLSIKPTVSGTRTSTAGSGSTAGTPPKATVTAKPTSKPTLTTKGSTPQTLDTAGLSAQEIKDRSAIQSAWTEYWKVNLSILKSPSSAWPAVASKVATEPLLSKFLASTADFKSRGVGDYGYAIHKFYWGPPVNGADVAIVGDCMDTSHLGTLDIKTGIKLTVGLPVDNTRASFAKGPDGVWRATGFQHPRSKC